LTIEPGSHPESLLIRFCQDNRAHILQPRRNLQIKFTRRVGRNEFGAYIDGIGKLDGASEKGAEASGLDRGVGTDQTGEEGRAALRLCNLAAQSPLHAEGGLQEEVERELTGKETEPWEIIYFKLYESRMPVIERSIETAALMLGSDRSRGYCLEMICADFLGRSQPGQRRSADAAVLDDKVLQASARRAASGISGRLK
jgi:hypothetical protein